MKNKLLSHQASLPPEIVMGVWVSLAESVALNITVIPRAVYERAVISARVGPRDLVFSDYVEFARMRETQGPSRLLARSAHSRAKAARKWGPENAGSLTPFRMT